MFASAAADAIVTDVDVWNINSVESVALEYSRYNNNVTDFYVADPFRSSDHDPAILGLNLAGPAEPTPVPTTEPTPAPTPVPTTAPTTAPTTEPTPAPTTAPTPAPTTAPTPAPTPTPTVPAATAPGTAPTAAPESALTNALRDKISTNASRYAAGSAITITAGSQHAGTFVSAWVRSTPVNLGGWLQVSTAGTVTTALPKDLAAGTHRIIVQDAAGAVIGWTEITIVAAGTAATGTLANTGVDSTPALGGALLLLLLGALLLRRRRSAVSGA